MSNFKNELIEELNDILDSLSAPQLYAIVKKLNTNDLVVLIRAINDAIKDEVDKK